MDVDLRVRQCERRIAALEREVKGLRAEPAGSPPPPAPVSLPVRLAIPVAAPLPVPRPAAPAGPPPPVPGEGGPRDEEVAAPSPASPRRRTLDDLERVFGVAVLGRVGIAALLLAAAYFAHLAYRHVSPVERVVAIYGLSALLVAAGAWARGRVAPLYVAILWGGGVAAAYMAGVVARLRYDLVGAPAALALLAGACAVGQTLARAAKAPALAVVALAGAFAAPLLVRSPGDPRTALLVYLLVLHAWAAYTEARWGWKGVRALGILGTVGVATTWAVRHGGLDASTYVHVHGYLAGLLAPDVVSAWRRARASPHAPFVVALAWPVEAVLLLGSVATERVTGFAALAGLAWWGTAAALSLRGRAPTTLVRPLARLGLVLLAAGAMLAWIPFRGDPQVLDGLVLASLAAASVVAVLGRRRLGVGDEAAALASFLAVGWLLAARHPNPWTALALVGPAALFRAGASAEVRAAGVALSVAALFAGLSAHVPADPAGLWLSVAFALSALAVALAHAVSRRRGDARVRDASEVGLAVLGGVWLVLAVRGPFREVPSSLGNPGTLAAAALCGALAHLRPWRAAPRGERGPLGLAACALAAVLAFAVWREADAAFVRSLPPEWIGAARGACIAGVAVLATAVGRRIRSEALVVCAALAFGGAVVHGSLAAAGRPSVVQAVHVAVLAAGLVASTALAPRTLRTPFAAGLLPVSLLWARFLSGDRADLGFALGNERFLSGAIVAAALVAASLRVGTRTAAGAFLRAGAAVVVYLAGLGELRDALSSLDVPWRRAWASVYSTFAAAGALAVGFRLRLSDLRWLALAGFALVVLKVGLHDLAMLDTPYRILVTAVLGAVLLLAAYSYARRATPGGARTRG